VALEVEPEPLLHHRLGHPLPVVGRLHGVEAGQRPPHQLLGAGDAGRRQVPQLVVVAGDAEVGGGDGLEGAQLLDVAVGDGGDGVSSHVPPVCPAVTPIRTVIPCASSANGLLSVSSGVVP
jgi:hypothetical protein